MSINRVTITGNLTRDPEMTMTASRTKLPSNGKIAPTSSTA